MYIHEKINITLHPGEKSLKDLNIKMHEKFEFFLTCSAGGGPACGDSFGGGFGGGNRFVF